MTTLKELNDALALIGIASDDSWINPPTGVTLDTLGFDCGPITTKGLVSGINKMADQLAAAEDQANKLVARLFAGENTEIKDLKEKVAHMAEAYNKLRSEHTAQKRAIEALVKANDLDAYQSHAMRTYKDTGYRNAQLLGALGLNGEAGEVAELIKKEVFHGKEFQNADLIKELGDVLWYLAVMARTVAGVSLSEIANTNIAKLRARYPDGFSEEKANNRVAGDA